MFKKLLSLVLMGTVLSGCAVDQEDKTGAFIQDLGDPNVEVREKAKRNLVWLGGVAVPKLLEAAEREQETLNLIDNYQYDEAITLQKSMIADLEKVKDKDVKGMIINKLELARNNLSQFERGKAMGDMRTSRKSAHYSSYQTTRSKSRRRTRRDDEI